MRALTDSVPLLRGNNGVAYIANRSPLLANPTSSPLNFRYTYNTSFTAFTTWNGHAAIVNAFYVTNMMHDIAYRYGFTESAGNFQVENFGKGGKEFDGVQVILHDIGVNSTSKAQMWTPPE